MVEAAVGINPIPNVFFYLINNIIMSMENPVIQYPISESVQSVNPTTVKSNKVLVIALSILLLVTVSIAGLFYFQVQKLSKELSKYQTQASPTPAVTPDPTSTNKSTACENAGGHGLTNIKSVKVSL